MNDGGIFKVENYFLPLEKALDMPSVKIRVVARTGEGNKFFTRVRYFMFLEIMSVSSVINK